MSFPIEKVAPPALALAALVLTAVGGRARAEEAFRAPGMGYHDLAAVHGLLDEWSRVGGAWVRPLDLGLTRGRRKVPAVLFGLPGPRPLEERPTLFLLGGLDGVSFAGGEAVLHAAHTLLTAEGIPNDLAFVAVPWAAPDGLWAAFEGRRFDGRDDLARDADGDGAVGEDPPDDVDADGRVLSMLVEDPAGPWVLAADGRALSPARPGEGPRYRLVREGRDDDGDGRYNEDQTGGAELDAQFPVGWRPGAAGGALPMEDPLARRLAALVLARRTVGVVVFQGTHGALAQPGGLSAGADRLGAQADASLFDRLARSLARHTRRPLERALPLCVARGRERPGAFIDWCYAVAGVPAVEVAPWGPCCGARRAAPTDAGPEPPALEPLSVGPPLDARQREWARWLDEERGGMGFVPWHSVELSPGMRALVGGWEPRTMHNPPQDELPAALSGLGAFVAEWATAAPRLELLIDEAEREEQDLVRLVVRVINRGALPSGTSTTGLWAGGAPPLDVRLELPVGARLVMGEARISLPPLPGGSASPSLEWLVLAPEASRIVVRASAPGCAPWSHEVRP